MSGNHNGKRAILYARTSYDDRDTDGRNLAGQLEMAREYALSKGYRIVAELAEDDKGASGASFELPKLGEVLEMAEAKEFDVLIPREIDRLSRNLAKQLIVEEELKRFGVDVEYALGEYPDTPEGRLNKHIRATIAEYEREKVVERMVRGRRNKVKAGNVVVNGNPPYGYRVAEVDGKTSLVTHEAEAKIVRMVFTWYVHGDGESGPLTIYTIAGKLSDMGIPTYADTHGRYKVQSPGKWHRSVVYKMLKNETYIGRWVYGKRNNPNGKWTENPDDHTLVVEVPAIVDLELWELAQAQLVENKRNGPRNLKYEYLLAKRVTCGSCGLKMQGQTITTRGNTYAYYRCPAARWRRDCARTCNTLLFRVDQTDAGIWDWIKGLLTDPETFARGLRKYQAQRDKENEPIRARLGVVDDILAENRRQLERLLDVYLAGDFPRELLTDRKNRLETTIRSLERERSGLVDHLEAGNLTEGQIQTLRDFVAKVGAGIDVAEADFQTRRGVIEALNVQAVLTVEDGEKVVRARCRAGDKVYNLRPLECML
jgi:site-specific DNA recombinase